MAKTEATLKELMDEEDLRFNSYSKPKRLDCIRNQLISEIRIIERSKIRLKQQYDLSIAEANNTIRERSAEILKLRKDYPCGPSQP